MWYTHTMKYSSLMLRKFFKVPQHELCLRYYTKQNKPIQNGEHYTIPLT